MDQRAWVARALRDETIGGGLLLAAATVGLLWANSPVGDSYADLTAAVIGPPFLQLSVSTWAADGLLAVFFFIAGLELKHELVLGSLNNARRAAIPIAAALGGMVVPALIFLAVNLTTAEGAPRGWGIPMATDIAFALAVLAVVSRRLPAALRASLLTLAVVDDLGAIIVIAIFYSHGFSLGWFVAGAASIAAYAVLQQRRVRSAWIYVPLALFTWFAVHESGIHATVAGVALGLLTRVKPGSGEESAPAERMEHLIRPLAAGLCVPLFAFASAGVDLRDTGLLQPLMTPVGIGVMVGLVVGKPVGVFAAAWVTARLTRAELNSSLGWPDMATIGLLAGIGFTVSLLITELAYPAGSPAAGSAKAAVLSASVIAALLATIAIRARNRHYEQVFASEALAGDEDPQAPDDTERGR